MPGYKTGISASCSVGRYFDYSEKRSTDETIGLLLDLANESGLR